MFDLDAYDPEVAAEMMQERDFLFAHASENLIKMIDVAMALGLPGAESMSVSDPYIIVEYEGQNDFSTDDLRKIMDGKIKYNNREYVFYCMSVQGDLKYDYGCEDGFAISVISFEYHPK